MLVSVKILVIIEVYHYYTRKGIAVPFVRRRRLRRRRTHSFGYYTNNSSIVF